MIYILFFILTFFITLDIRIFKRQERGLFAKFFQFPRWEMCVLALMFVLFILSADPGGPAMPFVFFLFVFPIYFLRRQRLVKALEDAGIRGARISHPLNEKSRLTIFSDALGVALGWMFGSAVLSLLVEGIFKTVGQTRLGLIELILTAILSSGLALILITKAAGKFSEGSFLRKMALTGAHFSLGKVIFLPALAGFIFAGISAAVLLARQIQPQTPLGEILETTNSPLILLAFLGIAILFAPLAEELIFRGYFYKVLSQVKSPRFAVIWIALTFGFLHVGQYWGDWLAILVVLVLGFVLTIFRAWTGSTLASVVMHYVYNTGVTIIPVLYLMLSNPAYFEYQTYSAARNPAVKEALLQKSIADHPEFTDAYNDLAWLYAEEQKNLDEALRLIDHALTAHPEHFAYLDTKAEVLLRLGRDDEALAVRERLLEESLSDEMAEYQREKIEELEGASSKGRGR